ncbi:Sugar phosphate permease [Peptoclostridium litorale DSM 5388]|uniref:Major facilitator superfamily (MFS) profile domain-containing protein n=1 Tax=Peptoclostridium litorale DSM 5388 TaxID=1121324 RepID=A0A069RHI6_PEPLI|nr:MFS transporter [Peptoclostridium litorale]KDR96481.1 hypothetical protein CLIT_2c00870 [Peptoclostridium litorale DSM 5388]SIN70091.1 Sugar phosphate permease [Peptoclostridium litorale DSM 5388]
MNKKTKVLLNLLVLGACWSIVYLIPFIQYVFYDPFQEMLGATNVQLGLLITIYGFGNIYGTAIGGWFADRFNYKKLYVGSVVANGICGFLFVMNPTYSFAMVMWVGFAISSLLMNYPAHIKIVRSLGGDEEQGKIFGLNESSIGLWNIIFNAIMMFLFARFLEGTGGLKAAIFGLSVLSCLLAIPAWFILDDPTKKPVNENAKKKEEPKAKMGIAGYLMILKSPATWLIAFSIFSIYSYLTTMTYFTPYFTNVLGASVAFAGWVAIIRTYVMTLVGAPIGGTLADKIKSPSKVLLGVNLFGMLALITLLNLSHDTPVFVLIALTLTMALTVFMARGCYYAVISELNVPREYTATTIGIAAAIGFSPDLFQFVLYGHWLDTYQNTGYTYMFTYQIAVLAIGAIAATLVLKNKKKFAAKDTLETETKLDA